MDYKFTNRKKVVNGVTVYKIKYENGTWGGWMDEESSLLDASISQNVILIDSDVTGSSIQGNVVISNSSITYAHLSFTESGKYNTILNCEITSSQICSNTLRLKNSRIIEANIMYDFNYGSNAFIYDSIVFNTYLSNCRVYHSDIQFSQVVSHNISTSQIIFSKFFGNCSKRFNFCMDSSIKNSYIKCTKVINSDLSNIDKPDIDIDSCFDEFEEFEPFINCSPIKIFDIMGFRQKLTSNRKLYIYNNKIYGENKLRKILNKTDNAYLYKKILHTLRITLVDYGEKTINEHSADQIIENRKLNSYFNKLF